VRISDEKGGIVTVQGGYSPVLKGWHVSCMNSKVAITVQSSRTTSADVKCELFSCVLMSKMVIIKKLNILHKTCM
jgi:hypothetical protein